MQTNETRHSFAYGFQYRVANCDIGERQFIFFFFEFVICQHSENLLSSLDENYLFFGVYFDKNKIAGDWLQWNQLLDYREVTNAEM